MTELDALIEDLRVTAGMGLPLDKAQTQAAIRELDALRAENAGLRAVIERVATSAREGLADCDDDCDMSAFWVLETLSASPPDALDAVKAAAWEEGAVAEANHWFRKPINPYRKENPNG